MSYWQATRHPAPCLLFLAPLLIAYEVGVLSLGSEQTLSLRNGADAWLRDGLSAVALTHPVAAPLFVVLVLTVWFFRQRDTVPEDAPSVCLGMAIESVAGALTLWGLSRLYSPLLDTIGLTLSAGDAPVMNTAVVGQVVTYVGAGIYEEVVFRLALFGLLRGVLTTAQVPNRTAIVLAAAASAILFAAAHHVGPHGEPVDGFNFLFRVLAGLYFTALYQLRGFGIAVGAHACYDVLVGVHM
ncbi:MAG TPA: CPBP family glutamic-type intramembrane protease [Gemmataceae bacterium]|jgi:membrane protease YdiL (CAAX protease family)|nr:CPBP family glutamic-type intramembrane protease [Gemmataceae bacterium]